MNNLPCVSDIDVHGIAVHSKIRGKRYYEISRSDDGQISAIIAVRRRGSLLFFFLKKKIGL